ncbi:hypothetical protein [Litchfieldia alkalitelluris]
MDYILYIISFFLIVTTFSFIIRQPNYLLKDTSHVRLLSI